MKILVVADTHKNYEALKAVVDKVDFDVMVHLGDGEHEFNDIRKLHPEKGMVYVAGNCDFGHHKEVHVMTACGIKIFCCHGHTFFVHDGLGDLIATAKKNNCKVALYGHTHLYRTEVIDGVCVMNPGSLDSPRGHNKPSFGMLTIDEKTGEVKMNIVAVSTRIV